MNKSHARSIIEEYFRHGLLTTGERTMLMYEIDKAKEVKSICYEQKGKIGILVDDQLIETINGKIKVHTVC